MVGLTGATGESGPAGVPGPAGPRSGGVVYTRWGIAMCRNGSELMSAGIWGEVVTIKLEEEPLVSVCH